MKAVSHSPFVALQQCALRSVSVLFPPHEKEDQTTYLEKNNKHKSRHMIILSLWTSTDTLPKITASSAREALEWDSRKHIMWGSEQPCQAKQHPPFQKLDKGNLVTEGLRGTSRPAARSPTLSRENGGNQSRAIGRAVQIPGSPTGNNTSFYRIRKLTWVRDTFLRTS